MPGANQCFKDLYALNQDKKIGLMQLLFGRDMNEHIEGMKTLVMRHFWEVPMTLVDCQLSTFTELPKLGRMKKAFRSTDFFWDNLDQWTEAHEQIKQARAEHAYALAGHIFGKTLVETTGGPVHPHNGILPDILPDVLPPIVIPDKVEAAAEILAGVLYGITKREGMDQLNECFYGADEFLFDFITAWNDVASETFAGLINGLTLAMETVMYIPKDIYECAIAGSDLHEFLQWASIIETPEVLVETIKFNIKRHLAALTIEMNKARKDLSYHEWTRFGEDLGEMMAIATTPMPSTNGIETDPGFSINVEVWQEDDVAAWEETKNALLNH